MAVAVVREFDVGDDRGTPNYDAVSQKMGIDENPPDGLVVHTAGFTDDGKFRIFDVWESAEHEERFARERLMPTMEELGAGGPPDREESYELHHVVAGPS